MDGLSSLATATALLQQAFHLFRHVSSARRFADSAGTLAALIAVEYFRFETWLQQSGLLVTDPSSLQFVVVSESSLRRAILLAAEMQSLTMDYDRVERHVLTVISQAYQCLEMLQKLREKYALHESSDVNMDEGPSSLTLKSNTEIPGVNPLFQSPQVAQALLKDENIRQRRAKVVSFFRKVNFSWSFKEDGNDRDRVMEYVQTLKYCNDALRECLPPLERQAVDRLVNLKALELSTTASDLKGIGSAASGIEGEIHNQIYQAMMIKARRVDASSQKVTDKELGEVEMNSTEFQVVGSSKAESPAETTNKRVMAKYGTSKSPSNGSTSMMLEWVNFSAELDDDDLDLLKDRIAILCTLLQSAGHPYFPALPLCKGFFQESRTSFALAYRLPSFAAPDQPPVSLYSILPRNKHSVEGEKAGGGGSITAPLRLPTLEQRYGLAAALADGVLSLLSVSWMHKTLSSHNVALYHHNGRTAMTTTNGGGGGSGQLDLSAPQLLGFGLARPERPGERTVDLRDERSHTSPWRFWLHPELRGGSGGAHRRFEHRFDIYALGVVLFEIGMWQDAHYYSSGGGGGDAVEFRRRLVHVCAREMAHRMGEAYKAAVMACLDADELWAGAAAAPGVVGEKPGGAYGADENHEMVQTGAMSLTELFYVHVFSVLRGCCTKA